MTGRERQQQLFNAARQGKTPEELKELFGRTMTLSDGQQLKRAAEKRARKFKRNLKCQESSKQHQ